MIDSVWRELEDEYVMPEFTGLVRRRVSSPSGPELYAAIEFPLRRRMLLLRISELSAAAHRRLPAAEGLQVLPVSIPEESPGSVTLALVLTDTRYSDVHAVLCDDIVRVLEAVGRGGDVAEVFLSRIVAWQRFLREHGKEGLSRLEIQGLYGELNFLLHWLLPVMPASAALAGWVGPKRAPHDYSFAAGSIEIKTSTTANRHIQINGEQQLDSSGVSSLWLFHLVLNESSTSGDSLPDLVSQVRDRLSGVPSNTLLFEDALLSAGYLSAHEGAYSTLRYRVERSEVFRVDGEFPRIVSSELRRGVSRVHYAIDVAECRRYIVSRDDFINALVGDTTWT